MKEPKFLSNRRILLICPSEHWGPRERRVFADALFWKEKGNSVSVLCLSDSFLAIKCKSAGVFCSYIHKQYLVKWRSLENILELKKILKKEVPELVHCYLKEMTLPLTFVLGRDRLTPLCFSFFGNIKEPPRLFLRFFARRIDKIFVTTEAEALNLQDAFPIHPKRIQATGLGISPQGKKKEVKIKQDCILLGAMIDSHLETIEPLEPLLFSLSALIHKIKDEFQKNVKFVLHGEKEWKKNLIYPELRSAIESLNLEGNIDFSHEPELVEMDMGFDIWLGTASIEEITDISLYAAYNQIPIIVPRSSSNSELILELPNIGLTYNPKDPRELREKVLQLLRERTKFKAALKAHKQTLLSNYGSARYFQTVNLSYQNALLIRERYFQSRSS